MSEISVRFKGYWEQLKDFTVEKTAQIKEVPRNVWLKNSPTILFLITFISYLIFASKGSSITWAIVFLVGLAYSIFLLHYWKKDREFNVYLTLAVLMISLPFASFEVFTYLLTKIFNIA
ncbi:hypothetical protein ACTWQB_13195 [Piscibacillus sp. B03]|uniref:hypothetical protein n=1 Tax=Piscibacillus sp. B03 TaxID=3457430 RepID=UPI003FCE09DA